MPPEKTLTHLMVDQVRNRSCRDLSLGFLTEVESQLANRGFDRKKSDEKSALFRRRKDGQRLQADWPAANQNPSDGAEIGTMRIACVDEVRSEVHSVELGVYWRNFDLSNLESIASTTGLHRSAVESLPWRIKIGKSDGSQSKEYSEIHDAVAAAVALLLC